MTAAFDSTMWLGAGAVVAAIVVFPGSIWLVLSRYIGNRLAYFIVASICLAALSILAAVWSFASPSAPLGPVGTLPSFKAVGVAEQASDINLAAAAQYPNGPWKQVSSTDTGQQNEAGLLTNDATDLLTQAIGSGKITTFASASDATADSNSVRLATINNTTYGAITFTPVKPSDTGNVIVVMRYDPGNVFGTARKILLGAFLLFLAHLVALYWWERKAARIAGRDIL